MKKTFSITLIAIIAGLWLALVIIQQPGYGGDFYPLYKAAQAVQAGALPYGEPFTRDLAREWPFPFAQAGFAYPLPVALLVTPLTVAPLALAGGVWAVVGLAGAWSAVCGRGWLALLLPIAFMPVHRAFVMWQASLIWLALAVALRCALANGLSVLAGACIAILPAKPQAGLVFALAGLAWAARYNLQALVWAGVFGLAVWGGSLAVWPGWLAGWLDQVRAYSQIVRPAWLLPFGLALPWALWRMPDWSWFALMQVVLFPLSDLYSALPLLLAWAEVGGVLALAGAGVSWLWVLLGLPNSIWVFWGLIMLPLLACGVWRCQCKRSYRWQS